MEFKSRTQSFPSNSSIANVGILGIGSLGCVSVNRAYLYVWVSYTSLTWRAITRVVRGNDARFLFSRENAHDTAEWNTVITIRIVQLTRTVFCDRFTFHRIFIIVIENTLIRTFMFDARNTQLSERSHTRVLWRANALIRASMWT